MRDTAGRTRILAAAAVAAFAVNVWGQQGPGPQVIYGDDDRLDLYQVKDPRLLKLADSTVALFEGSNVTVEAGTARLTTQHYGTRYSLCKDEPFFDQPMGAFCSGSLVGPDLLMTAGHCVTSQSSCEDTKFVFGFAITQEGKHPQSVPSSNVYGCSKLLGREEVGRGADWALIKLDRRVEGHAPLAVNRQGDPAKGTPLVVIGHPAGLPTKVAGGSTVRDPSPNGFFVADLDTYGGNSGSAVFNARNGLVEGILVRGETDYIWRDGCRRSNVCEQDGCRGEDVTKVSALLSNIPAPGGAAGEAVAARVAEPGPAFRALLDVALRESEVPQVH